MDVAASELVSAGALRTLTASLSARQTFLDGWKEIAQSTF